MTSEIAKWFLGFDLQFHSQGMAKTESFANYSV
jgi:hypothetical protein